MTTDIDAARLLTYMDEQGLDASKQVSRGWNHMGAIVVDAVLQRRQRYKATVEPRVRALIASWPDGNTTKGFRQHMSTGDLGSTIRWKSGERLEQITKIVSVLETEEIDTVEDLRARLSTSPEREHLRALLRQVKHVGPKTLDYFEILTGSNDAVAIDVRILKIASNAGITNHKYSHLSNVIHRAASMRGWRPGDLDAVLWNAA